MSLHILALAFLAAGGPAPSLGAHDSRSQVGVTLGGYMKGVYVTASFHKDWEHERYEDHRRDRYRHERSRRDRYYCGYHRKYHRYGKHRYPRPRAICGRCGIFHPCWDYSCRLYRPRRPVCRPYPYPCRY